jgi:hypothetical protein
MELVLNDELRREESLREGLGARPWLIHDAIYAPLVGVRRAPEQDARIAPPRHPGELVDCRDEEARNFLVNLFVDEQHWQSRPGTFASVYRQLLSSQYTAAQSSSSSGSVKIDELDVLDLDGSAAQGR